MGVPGLAGAGDRRPGGRGDAAGGRGEEHKKVAVKRGEAQGEGEDAVGCGRLRGGREGSERGGARRRGGEMENAAEMAEAARRAAETGRRRGRVRGCGAGGGGWLRRSGGGGEGLSDARSPLAHPARTVFPLAKSQRLYRSLSDPPNWLLMTP